MCFAFARQEAFGALGALPQLCGLLAASPNMRCREAIALVLWNLVIDCFDHKVTVCSVGGGRAVSPPLPPSCHSMPFFSSLPTSPLTQTKLTNTWSVHPSPPAGLDAFLSFGAGVEALLALLMQGPTPASHFYAGRALVHVATDHPEGKTLVIGRLRQALICPNTLQFQPPPCVGDEQLKEIQQVHEQVRVPVQGPLRPCHKTNARCSFPDVCRHFSSRLSPCLIAVEQWAWGPGAPKQPRAMVQPHRVPGVSRVGTGTRMHCV